MPKFAVASLCAVLCLLAASVAVAADEGPSFQAPFDRGLAATHCESGAAEPTHARGLSFVPGVRGEAVYVGGFGDGAYDTAPLLEYDAGEHFSGEGGTVMFWVSPDWDGYFTDPIRFDTHFLFAALGGADTPDFTVRDIPPNDPSERLWLFMWNWLRCDLHEEAGEPAASLAWRCRNTWMRGDWWHVAITWRPDGWSKLYVNGVPRALKCQPRLADMQRFYVGCLPRVWNNTSRANAAYDELSLYRRALGDDEVLAEFRRVAPLDFTLERRYLRAGEPEAVTLEVEPGTAGATVNGALQLRVLADADGREMARREYAVKGAKRQALEVKVGALPVGAYRLECELTHGETTFRRSFPLTVYEQQAAPEVSREDVKLGECITRLDCTSPEGLLESAPSTVKTVEGVGGYREAGESKWDRFGYEITVPGADGSPVMLEITWPDDRERAMSFYMLPKSDSALHRDRLSGGIQCGGEYPSSGTMQTVRYLFYPTEEQYLFEARTLVPGMPAAVGGLTIHRLAERLPKLALELPKGLPGRAFGHLDEDQSFEVLFGGPADKSFRRSPLPNGYPIQCFERLLDYLDYTGQNVMSYPLLRYTWSHLDAAPVNSVGEEMRVTGWVDLLLEMMQRRGKQLIASVNIWTVPTQGATWADRDAQASSGYFRADRNGKYAASGWEDPGLGDNPSHPAVRAGFVNLFGEMLRRYGKQPAFAGIDLWCDRYAPFLYTSLDLGYDDLTVSLFERETGVRVPVTDTGEGRFAARWHYLMHEKRDEWLAWRARRNTALLAELDGMVRRTRPDLQLQVTVAGWYGQTPEFLDAEQCEDFDFARWAYENLGLDLAALKKLPSVVLAPMPDGTYYRWLKHWYGGRENITGELNHNVQKFEVFRNGARSATSIYLRYFECFTESLRQDVYKAYFQNSDPKAHGRYFLQDFGVALAAQDAGQILIGAQPLGTTGRDAEAREFAQAYRALPMGDYRDAPGSGDPVTARYLNTSSGTYVYTVNLAGWPVTATLSLPGDTGPVTDLARGGELECGSGRLTVELRPFELRSFRLVGREAEPRGLRVGVAGEVRRWFAGRLEALRADVEALAGDGADASAYRQRLERIAACLEAGQYAEAHRLMVSRLMRGIPEVRQAAADGYLKEKAQMLSRSEYAVDCGSAGYYRAKSGRLFWPDHAYTEGGYGYDGGYQSVGRWAAGLTGTDDPELYATEAYDLDAYRFTVKPGRYTVRLYLKVGYEPGAKPGAFVMSVDVEGQRLLSDCDLFEACDSDFRRATVREFRDVEVRDGVLDVEFSIPGGGKVDPTARLCDAIEVIGQP